LICICRLRRRIFLVSLRSTSISQRRFVVAASKQASKQTTGSSEKEEEEEEEERLTQHADCTSCFYTDRSGRIQTMLDPQIEEADRSKNDPSFLLTIKNRRRLKNSVSVSVSVYEFCFLFLVLHKTPSYFI
jgi:hypothetical protein